MLYISIDVERDCEQLYLHTSMIYCWTYDMCSKLGFIMRNKSQFYARLSLKY